MATFNVYKKRTNVKKIDLGVDVSNDDFVSEIRAGKNSASSLIATWDISFETDGTDGVIILTLDDSALQNITHDKGYMDVKRISGGEPYPVFENYIMVRFHETVTV